MIINIAGVASLAYDMYKSILVNPVYDSEGKPIITAEMGKKYFELQKGTTNYLTNEKNETFFKNVTLNCLDLMEHVGAYGVGEFDCHNNKQLNEVGDILIKNGYYGKVGIIKSEEIMEREIALAESDIGKNSVPEEKLLRGNPYRLFERYTVDGNKYFFKSLLTGIDAFELDPKEMIYLSLDGGINFRRWGKINMEYVAGKSRVIDAVKALSKTVQVIVRNEESFKTEAAQIDNPSVFFEIIRRTGTQGAKEQNIYQEMPIIDGARVRDMMDIIQSIYEKECQLLGFTVNSNDKKERLTVAENYKDMRQITNIQDFQLKSLKIFEERLKEKGGVEEDFKIEISGLTYAQGLPETVTPDGDIVENPNNEQGQQSQQ